jgi:hypothetical protein
MLADCTVEQVRQSLHSNAIVLLSCHGEAVNTPDGPRFVVKLSDGSFWAEQVFPTRVSSPLVILSACDSGVYYLVWGDYPLGAGPELLRRGARAVIGARFPIRAEYAGDFVACFGRALAAGTALETAFARALEEVEQTNADLWRDLACLELLKAV